MAASPWPRVALSDLVRVHHGYAFPSDACGPPTGDVPRLIRIGDFARTAQSDFQPGRVQGYFGEYSERFRLSPGDLLMAMTCQSADGEILGVCMTVPADGETYLHNQRIGRVEVSRPEVLDLDFLKYALRAREFNRHLFRTASGSKILHTAPERILAYQLPLPPIDEQRQIAAVLGALDDLIAGNRRLIGALFELSQARFTESISRLSTSAPVASFLSTVDVLSGGTPSTKNADYWGGEIPWFSIVDAPIEQEAWVLSTERTITQVGLSNCSAALVPMGTTILSARGTVGKTALAGRPMAVNQSCYALRGKFDEHGIFTYFMTRSLVDELRRSAHGSVFDTITRSTLASMQVPQVEGVDIAAFDESVWPLMEQIRQLVIESRDLAGVRDDLLHPLLSGRIKARGLAA